MSDALNSVIQKTLTSFIGRVVLAGYTLVIVPVMPSIINFTNNVLGYNLTDAQVQAYANRASIGVGALAAIWLLNNGLFERAVVKAKSVIDAADAAGEGGVVGDDNVIVNTGDDDDTAPVEPPADDSERLKGFGGDK